MHVFKMKYRQKNKNKTKNKTCKAFPYKPAAADKMSVKIKGKSKVASIPWYPLLFQKNQDIHHHRLIM